MQQILEEIQKTGSDHYGYEAGGISADTFYKWLKQKPEFAEGVASAREQFRKNAPETLRKQAKRCLWDYLHNGVIETWETVETFENAAGEVQWRKHSTKTVRRQAPNWAIERLLGPEMDELQALKILIESQWLPIEVLNKIGNQLEQLKEAAWQALQPSVSNSDSLP